MDTDRPVNELLIRFCATFLDQGVGALAAAGPRARFLPFVLLAYTVAVAVRPTAGSAGWRANSRGFRTPASLRSNPSANR